MQIYYLTIRLPIHCHTINSKYFNMLLMRLLNFNLSIAPIIFPKIPVQRDQIRLYKPLFQTKELCIGQ